MNFKNDDEVSFFKILLCDSVDYLPLPTAFAKKFLENGDNKKHTLVLKPKSAVKWSVKYVKMEEKYYFMDGWLNFMKDNRLQVGDFLVFWLLSASPKSTFQVFIYAPNGCLKPPLISSGAGNQKKKKPFVKQETSDDDTNDGSLEDVRKSFQIVFKKSRVHHLPMNKSFWKATGMDGCDGVRLRNDEGKTWEVKVSQYGNAMLPYLTRGWVDFWKGNKIKVGNMCEIYHVEGNLFHLHVIKKPRRGPWKKTRSN